MAPDAAELKATCLSIAEDDEAGQKWCNKNNYPGYTSYGSLDDLGWRFPIFQDLVKALDKQCNIPEPAIRGKCSIFIGWRSTSGHCCRLYSGNKRLLYSRKAPPGFLESDSFESVILTQNVLYRCAPL